MDRSARARSFRLKSEWTQSAPGPRGPSSFLFAHPPSPLSRNGQEATKPTGSSSVRALRARTLFQVSPDGPVACPRQVFRLRAACLVFIFYLLWPYVDAILEWWFLGFSCFFLSDRFRVAQRHGRFRSAVYQSSISTTRVSSSRWHCLTARGCSFTPP